MKYFNYVMYDLFRRRQKKKTEDKLTIVTIGLKGLLTQLQNFTTKDCSWWDLEKIQRNITTF